MGAGPSVGGRPILVGLGLVKSRKKLRIEAMATTARCSMIQWEDRPIGETSIDESVRAPLAWPAGSVVSEGMSSGTVDVPRSEMVFGGAERVVNLTAKEIPSVAQLKEYYEKTMERKGLSWANAWYLNRFNVLLHRSFGIKLEDCELVADNNVWPFPVQPFLSIFNCSSTFYSFRADIFQTLIRCKMGVLLVLAEIRPTGPELRSIPGGSGDIPKEDGSDPTEEEIKQHAFKEFFEEISAGSVLICSR